MSWFESAFRQDPPRQEWEKISIYHCPALAHDPFAQRLCNYLKLDMRTGPWLAGGSVRKLYFKEMIGQSDWDIWFQSRSQFDDAVAKLERLIGCELKHRSNNAITYSINGESVQLIKRNFYPSVTKLIESFDMTVCQFATDGDTIKTSDLAIGDSNKHIIRLTKDVTKPGIMKRITKYVIYGFRPTQELLDDIEENKHLINFYQEGFEYDE